MIEPVAIQQTYIQISSTKLGKWSPCSNSANNDRILFFIIKHQGSKIDAILYEKIRLIRHLARTPENKRISGKKQRNCRNSGISSATNPFQPH
jgi:hypothetical protein